MAKLPFLPRLHPEIEKNIHAALEAKRAKDRATPRTRLSLSELGNCVRDLWASRNGIPDERPPEGPILKTFDVGSKVEDVVVEWLNLAGYAVMPRDPKTGEQWRVTIGEIASGRLDGILQWGTADFRLLEVKSAKTKKFEELLEARSYRAWNPKYYAQVQTYMGASHDAPDVPTLDDSLVIVVCKDDARIYAEMIRFDADHYETLVDKANAAMGKEMPNRPAEAKGKSSGFCKWCSRNGWCYSALAGVEFDQ